MPTTRQYFTAFIDANIRNKDVNNKVTQINEADAYEACANYTDDICATKADLDAPVFTGIPEAPTASTGTDTEQIATTAFVQQELLANASSVLTWMAPVYQDSTNDPSPQTRRINTIDQGTTSDANYRKVEFGRNSTGFYYVQVSYKTSGFVSASKIGVTLCDAVCRATGISSGSSGGLLYHRFEFKTYDPATGSLADGLLTGFNFIKVEIFP